MDEVGFKQLIVKRLSDVVLFMTQNGFSDNEITRIVAELPIKMTQEEYDYVIFGLKCEMKGR